MWVQQRTQRLPRAMQADFHDIGRHAEQPRRFLTVEPLDVPQQQHRPVSLRELRDASANQRRTLAPLDCAVDIFFPVATAGGVVPVFKDEGSSGSMDSSGLRRRERSFIRQALTTIRCSQVRAIQKHRARREHTRATLGVAHQERVACIR